MTRRRGAVFFDRDGTLNREVGYLHRIEDFVWIPGAREAVRRINRAGLLAIVVTNQAGVARGYYEEADVDRLHAHMQRALQAAGAHVDAFYYCPYHPAGVRSGYRRDSPMRKPGAGMYQQAMREGSIDPAQSHAVGDRNSDLAPARMLGMSTMLVLTGYGMQERAATNADGIAADVGQAVDCILSGWRSYGAP